MTKLTDTQAILLSTASQRADGNLLPLPATLRPGGGTAKAMISLIRRGLALERHAVPADAAGEQESPYGVFLTAEGAAAIGVDLPEQDSDGEAAEPPAAAASSARTPSKPSKAGTVLTMLERPDGATLAELVEATGWLPHTTRAALTGIRKKGHAVVRGKRDGATCYRVGGVA